MSADFVHLHVHSHYSLLDGACTIKGLAQMAKLYDMPGVAVTDHGYMGGTIDLHQEFAKHNLKPIVGCEVYVAPTTRFDRDSTNPNIRGFHLVLLAENLKGYHSLCKLLSEAWLNGMYYKPRIDKALLAEFHDGLIGLSACIGGEIPHAILAGDHLGAEKVIAEYIDILGKENFFLEIMDHGLEKERISNRALIGYAKKFNLPLVATNDVHYLKKEHAEAHEIMLCIQTQSKLSDPNHMSFEYPEFYFKSPDEMKALFREVPEAVTNTVAVAERCGFEFTYAPAANHYPVFKLPDAVEEKTYLRDICLKNMEYRYGFNAVGVTEFSPEQQQVIDRMDYELGIIDGSKYCSYFLVVSDFIKYAKDHGIPVGPGRGSGAGSVVAYLTLITDIDPLRYDLLFERFLNPERVSPPDFDIDFCEARRSEVIDYVRRKYGEDSVSQICTYGTLKAKAVVKDVARVLGHDFSQGDRITKLIPSDPHMTLAQARVDAPELAKMIAEEPYVANIFKHAEVLEGINRQLGIHAAGVIICDQRLDNLIPLAKGAKGEIITEFPAVPCENLGLLKMDFLGLRTLTIIQNAVDIIEKRRGVKLDMSKIPLNDPRTFELLNRGDTISVFQLESSGMQNLCRTFGVENIKHIIALIAIYRPGPMQFIGSFIKRKRGEEPILYDHPKMEQYLAETYGIMLYQEQIMQVVQVLAGFSLGGADILRRAIGKKKADVLAQQKSKFVAGCAKYNDISAKVAEDIWSKIETFAGYGFNKSHSAAYAFVAYRTAYLKANYPVEFMTAVLTGEIDNAEKIAFLINACRDMNIAVLPPDVNTSDISFSADGDAIRFGLGAIKGVGEVAAGKIIAARKNGGKYKSFSDFCERAGEAVNSRMIEHLTRAGAFDALGLRRSQILAVAEAFMRAAQSKAKDRAAGQGSLFDMLGAEAQEEIDGVNIPDIPEFEPAEILKSEKELLGFYVTGHPLLPYRAAVEALSTVRLNEMETLAANRTVRLAGMTSSVTTKFSKKNNKPYCIVVFEDLEGACELMVYEKALEKLGEKGFTLIPEQPVLITATVSRREENEAPRLIAEDVEPLENAMSELSEELLIYLDGDTLKRDTMVRLMKILANYPGRTPSALVVSAGTDRRKVFIENKQQSVKVSPGLFAALDALLGPGRLKLKVAPLVEIERNRFRGRYNSEYHAQ